eukprot:UN10635
MMSDELFKLLKSGPYRALKLQDLYNHDFSSLSTRQSLLSIIAQQQDTSIRVMNDTLNLRNALK